MRKLKYLLVIVQLFIIVNPTFGQSMCSEAIFLHSDRDIYIAGEELFFKCYRFDVDGQKPHETSKYVYLVLRNEKNVLVRGICFKLNKDMFSGGIYLPDTLSTGRYQLVSYTNYMRNFGEETYFTKEILIANRFDKDLMNIYANSNIDTLVCNVNKGKSTYESNLLSLKPEKEKYATRDKIKVELEAIGLKEGEIAKVSVSVHEKTIKEDNIQLKKAIIKPKSLQCRYLPETKGIIMEGNVLDASGKQGVPNAMVLLSSADTIANLQLVRTDANGYFRFLLNDYYNNKNIVLTLPDNINERIVLLEKFGLKNPFNPTLLFSNSSILSYVAKSQNILQVQKSYKLDTALVRSVYSKLQVIVPQVYMPLSSVVYPSDFQNLPDFIEVSREIVPNLRTRKQGSTYEAKIFNLQKSTFFDQSPMIFLDGVPIQSINQVINLGSDKIKKIETVPEERYYGGLYFPGILSIYSNSLEINNIKPEVATLNSRFMQLQPESFWVSSKVSKLDRTPDFKQLLYWEPYLSISSKERKTIEFYASDNKGEFEIVVEGITSLGTMINVKTMVRISLYTNNK